jgi:FKBP-type peptidyl-prolyl cis-trans isomerase
MLNRILTLAVFAALLFQGCTTDKYTETDSGLRYCRVVEGSGPGPENGSVMLMSISYMDINDNILFSSGTDPDGLMALSYVDSMFVRDGGIEEGIRMIRKGDSLVLKFPIEDLYENTFNVPLPDTLARGSDVTVCIKAEEMYTAEEYQAYRAEQFQAQQAEARKAAEAQLETDGQLIDEYLAANGLEAQTHQSGLRYNITQQGSGELARNGQTVFVSYTGRLLNGNIFDTSDEELSKELGKYNPGRPYGPLSFVLGTGGVIQGWDIGVSLLNPGSKCVLYVPSSLGYGPRSMGPDIPPNSIMVFDVELVKVEN